MSKFVWLLILSAFSLSAEIMTVCADKWMPYNGDPNSSSQGYIIDLMREVYEPEIKIDYKVLPWKRALQYCENGEINAVVGAYAEDVPGFVLPADAVDFCQDAFFKLSANNWVFKDLSSLKSQSLGYIIDYATDEGLTKYIDENKQSGKVQLVGGEDPLVQNIKKLLAGRITVLLDNYSVVKYKLKEMKVPEKSIVPAGFFKDDMQKVYIAFSPKNSKSKHYAEIFERKFKELKASGIVNKIRKKYNMDPLK